MKQVIDFFKGLFDSEHWPARWKCGSWTDFHGWLYIVSDLMIWLAYFMIPVIIINYFSKKKTQIRFHAVYILFASFILLCGTTHFLDAVMFWVPVYRFNALIRFITGVVSLFTVYYLFRLLPLFSKARTNMELELEIANRQKVELELAQANASLSAFASLASHDLQEPVRKILLYAGMVSKSNEEVLNDASKAHMGQIIKAADRMRELIKSVLALSSVNEKEHLEMIDPSDAVQAAIENLELKIKETDTKIHLAPLPKLRGSVPYLSQVFSNLISNAIKFNEQRPEIWITGTEAEDNIIIEVSDNGIGIDASHAERIFEAFQRLHPKSSKYEGSGIGLAICKKIMEIHGGSIAVESRAGQGSRFLLRFPRPAGILQPHAY